MKLISHSSKVELMKQKRKYKILSIIALLGIILGISFLFVISKEDKQLVVDYITNFFNTINDGKELNYIGSLLNSLINNILYITIIWLLGISIIGIPIIVGILLFKSFVFGFSFSSIIYTYGFKGTIGALLYTFPHQIGYLFILILLSFYALNFSFRLFKYLFLRQTFNFKEIMRRYLKLYLFSLIVVIILSLFETYISTYLLKLFTLLLK